MAISVLRSPGLVAGIVVGLLLGLLSVFWPSGMPLSNQASAQVPDSGAQRNLMVKELASLNGKMDTLIKLITSGQIKVICIQADDNKTEAIGHETKDPKIPVRIPAGGTDRTGGNSN